MLRPISPMQRPAGGPSPYCNKPHKLSHILSLIEPPDCIDQPVGLGHPYAREAEWRLGTTVSNNRTCLLYHQPRLRATQSVSRADSANACYHPSSGRPKSVRDSSRECGAQ
jgi:hypothetical protein